MGSLELLGPVHSHLRLWGREAEIQAAHTHSRRASRRHLVMEKNGVLSFEKLEKSKHLFSIHLIICLQTIEP